MTSRSGPSFELYQRARRFEVIFILCEAHFRELAQVLTYDTVLRLGSGIITPSYAFSIAAELHRIGEYHDRVPGLDWPSCPDPKDWYLLDLLIAAEADGIVSKDKHLLGMVPLGLPVMTPAEMKRQGLI